MDIIKVVLIGLTGVLAALLLKKEKAEFSTLISLGLSVCICIFTITKVEGILAFVKKIESMLTIDSSYLSIVLRMIGIAYAAEFAASICKDAGYAAVGQQVEIFAKISILVISMPVLTTFLETLEQFL